MFFASQAPLAKYNTTRLSHNHHGDTIETSSVQGKKDMKNVDGPIQSQEWKYTRCLEMRRGGRLVSRKDLLVWAMNHSSSVFLSQRRKGFTTEARRSFYVRVVAGEGSAARRNARAVFPHTRPCQQRRQLQGTDAAQKLSSLVSSSKSDQDKKEK
jgi:hypothetical protein